MFNCLGCVRLFGVWKCSCLGWIFGMWKCGYLRVNEWCVNVQLFEDEGEVVWGWMSGVWMCSCLRTKVRLFGMWMIEGKRWKHKIEYENSLCKHENERLMMKSEKIKRIIFVWRNGTLVFNVFTKTDYDIYANLLR